MEIDVKQEDYYICERCDITSLKEGRMCPCPRGSCEAKISGTVTTRITLDMNTTPEQERSHAWRRSGLESTNFQFSTKANRKHECSI